MTPRQLAGGLVVLSIVLGTVRDQVADRQPITLGSHRVLAADFHVHSSTWSGNGVTPWGLVLEARRQGLDAIAVTGHNQVLDSKIARWFSRISGGPTVLTGEEIHSPAQHIIAVGIEETVDWRLSASDQIDDVHRQGGVAIAAHPFVMMWPEVEDHVARRLDGAEICHPMVYVGDEYQRQFEALRGRVSVAAIGSSDFHGLGRLGMCRTYVFARENSAEAILEAIRGKRTVVYGRNGTAYGDPTLITLAAANPRLREDAATDRPPGWLDRTGHLFGVFGLLGLIVIRNKEGPAPPIPSAAP